nr:methyltransferase domain-containing protein [Phytohabitans houttuyneae]
MSAVEAGKQRIAGVFDRAAPTYEQTGVAFFDPIGAALAERAGLRAGERVLDVGCGRGASLLPAAEAVGPSGVAAGIDLAPGMVAATAAEARRRGLTQVHVKVGDAEAPTSRMPPSTLSSAAWCCSSCPMRRRPCARTPGCCVRADGSCSARSPR